jgi:epoxide hydrolase-like predicted phosphatase
MIKAVLFDFFGVISSEVSPFWFQKHFSPDEAARLKEEYMTPADRGDLSEDEVFDTLSRLSGEKSDDIRRDFASRLVINGDTVRLIESLKGRYKTVLVSNAMRDYLRRILKENDLERLFDSIVISGEEGIIKPGREIFELALERAGVLPEEAVFIDDNEGNIEGAKSAGIAGILFKDPKGARVALSELGVE